MNQQNATPTMTPQELEGRLSAQRHVLQWLLRHIVENDPSIADQLLDALNESSPPQDHQEDPGAVPTIGFATLSAATAEIRLLLEPVKEAQKMGRTPPSS